MMSEGRSLLRARLIHMKLLNRLFILNMLGVFCLGLLPANPLSSPEMGLAQTTDPVLVAAGDIANCKRSQDEETAKLIDGIPGTVVTLGDNAYPDGMLTHFNNCYGPTWGRHKDRTRPVPGNHEYHSPGAAGYYTYFGTAASPLDANCTNDCKGYYAYDLGSWHIIALNSEIDHNTGSVQEQWLRADLAEHQNVCTLAYWHRPRFSSGRHGSDDGSHPIWQALYEYGADVVLNGHDHSYERFAPQDPSGQADPAHGIREFVVGTGGAGFYNFPTIRANSEARNNSAWGVLKLTLHPASYDWEFIPIAGQTFTDTGSASCVSARPDASDVIFAAGFESGDLSVWSASNTDGGDLSASAAAALVGSQGLQAVINDDHSIYVDDKLPNAEPRYRVRFYFDPNSISMANGDAHQIFYGYAGKATKVLRLEFRQALETYQLRGRLLDDSNSWINTDWFTLSDAPHSIELDWRAASSADSQDGTLALWIDGVPQAGLTGIDNDTRRIDRVRLGAVAGVDPGTRGTYFFDAFESRRETSIVP